MKEYGYRDERDLRRGNYPSGSRGSGVVPVSLTIVIVFSLILAWKVFVTFRTTFLSKES